MDRAQHIDIVDELPGTVSSSTEVVINREDGKLYYSDADASDWLALAGGNITISSASASGGSNGDIWIIYTP